MNPDLPRSGRLALFQEVLSAAAQTRFYRPLLERVSLASQSAIDRLDTIDEALSCLPRSDLHAILEDFEALLNPGGRPPVPRELFYPLGEPPRTAILAPGFRENRRLRVFDGGSWRGLRRYRPEALAGPAGVLRALAIAVREGRTILPPLTYPIIVFTGIEHGLLRAADRDLFWQVFGVPVFEQLRGLGSELLAAECEAHHGLHVRSEEALVELEGDGGETEIVYTSLTSFQYPLLRLATGLSAGLHDMLCECGATVPRLTALRRLPARKARAAVSAAG